MYLYKLTHIEICMTIHNHDNNHDLMVVLICLALDSRRDNGAASDENSNSCVNDDCGKSFVIFLSYKNAYYIQETKTVLVKEDCR